MASRTRVSIESLTELRKIVGTDVREQDLVSLLERHHGDVNAAANVRPSPNPEACWALPPVHLPSLPPSDAATS